MTVYVFTGPTLPAERAREELDAVYLPPVRQGDLYRAALNGPAAIGIIDGFFEQVPSVWHKEILWALAEGIPVFGSASMGALRAAELAPFGMVGVGAVFQAYRDETLTDDDEVALRHGPAETGYIPVSEAMVNIRATLAAAAAAGVLGPATQDRLERLAKSQFYPERSYPQVLELGLEADLPRDEIEALRDWLPEGRVDQKRLDAVAMLREMKAHLAAPSPPRTVGYLFETTDIWEGLTRSASLAPPGGGEEEDPHRHHEVLEEFRLQGELFGQLERRASAKRRVLGPAADQGHRLSDQDFTADDLAAWYFQQHFGCAPPRDLERYARRLGFAALEDFYRAVLREYLYQSQG